LFLILSNIFVLYFIQIAEVGMNKHEYFYLLTTQVILILYCLINVPLAGSNALDVEKGLSPLYMDSPLAALVIDKVGFLCVLHCFQCRVLRFEYPPVFFERN
jgi:hypothetical protein